MLKAGHIVGRKSYNCDIYFKIAAITEDNKYTLKGLNHRLTATADENDIIPIMLDKLLDFKKMFSSDIDKKIQNILSARNKNYNTDKNSLKKPGKVLHIDSDRDYLNLCIKYYKKLEIPVTGENISEAEQSSEIISLLKKYTPDILVITGHDALISASEKGNIDNYKNSAFFIDTIKNARNFQSSMDSLIIIAGACQSYYEALISSGANIASSPKRILIHALDPVFIAEKLSYTPIDKLLKIDEIIENSISGIDGLGGLQAYGTCREGYPSI